MTEQTTEAPTVPQVAGEPGTRLEQLHAAYASAKSEAAAAAEALKTVTDAIKLELTQAVPDAPSIDLVGEGLPPLRLTYVESWRVDSRKLKAEDPETYVRYAKKSGSWTLKARS